MRFERELGQIVLPDGRRIVLTAWERRALEYLSSAPGRVRSRAQILDAITGHGSDSYDRSVDYLISRLRRKIGDDARKPRYIGTRYGDGYVWIGDAKPDDEGKPPAVLIRAGSVDDLPDPEAARALRTHVEEALEAELGATVGTGSEQGSIPDPGTERIVELIFLRRAHDVVCVVTLRSYPGERPEASCEIHLEPGSQSDVGVEIRRLVDAAWVSRVCHATERQPLPVSLHHYTTGEEAPVSDRDGWHRRIANRLSRPSERSLSTWQNTISRLSRLLDNDPRNPRLKILLATAIHTKWLMTGAALLLSGTGDKSGDEDRIEELVLDALPHLGADPAQSVMAGKLLHFLRRGYDEQGRELCEQALGASAEVARSLAVIGQMRAMFGETDAALACFSQATRLTPPGGDAHLYALVMKCQALAAAGRWDELELAGRALWDSNRASAALLRPVFTSPTAPDATARAVVAMMSRRGASARLSFLAYVGARLFRDPAHGRNLMAPVTVVMTRRFGEGVVPQDVRQGGYYGAPDLA